VEATIVIVTLLLAGDPAPVQVGCRTGTTKMRVMNWIGLALAVGLGVYLVVALLFPEKFE
jgi:K+-transporting ATPase KdpF subunit